jgi:hypothetical protein
MFFQNTFLYDVGHWVGLRRGNVTRSDIDGDTSYRDWSLSWFSSIPPGKCWYTVSFSVLFTLCAALPLEARWHDHGECCTIKHKQGRGSREARLKQHDDMIALAKYAASLRCLRDKRELLASLHWVQLAVNQVKCLLWNQGPPPLTFAWREVNRC